MTALVNKQRRNFDPNNKEDVKEFKAFMQNSSWEKGCPFNLEYPFLNIPDMIKDKLVRNLLGVK